MSFMIDSQASPTRLKLYVSETCEKVAVASVQEAIAALPDEKFELSIINVREQPELAESDNVIATPTLILITKDGEPRRLIGGPNAILIKQFLIGLNLIFDYHSTLEG